MSCRRIAQKGEAPRERSHNHRSSAAIRAVYFVVNSTLARSVKGFVVPRESERRPRKRVVATLSQVAAVNPFSTAVPIWGQTILIPSDLSPKRGWGPKRVNHNTYIHPTVLHPSDQRRRDGHGRRQTLQTIPCRGARVRRVGPGHSSSGCSIASRMSYSYSCPNSYSCSNSYSNSYSNQHPGGE